jgi:hypothetical protein
MVSEASVTRPSRDQRGQVRKAQRERRIPMRRATEPNHHARSGGGDRDERTDSLCPEVPPNVHSNQRAAAQG